VRTLVKSIALFIAGALLAALVPQSPASAQSQTNTGRCIFNVPAEWGSLKGVSERFGLIFEDSAGNLRTISSMPCGFEQAPNVALEIHRK
jgi:hypothetical protein